MICRIILFWLLSASFASAISNQITTFGYDADGNQLWKQGFSTNTLQVWIGGNYEEKDGKILFHISAGDRLVYTYSSDGIVAEYYHPDHLHSAEVMSTASGGLYQHYEYGAYGNSRYTSARPLSRPRIVIPVSPSMRKRASTTSVHVTMTQSSDALFSQTRSSRIYLIPKRMIVTPRHETTHSNMLIRMATLGRFSRPNTGRALLTDYSSVAIVPLRSTRIRNRPWQTPQVWAPPSLLLRRRVAQEHELIF
jgi:hypothetical protein